MSPPGRPKGESRSAKHEGNAMSPPGRPKGDYPSAKHEGNPMSAPGRPNPMSAARPAVIPAKAGIQCRSRPDETKPEPLGPHLRGADKP